MKRTLFTFFSALSLLLFFAAVCVLWVRSYWATDTWAWFQPDMKAGRATEWRARSERGWIRFSELKLSIAKKVYSSPTALKQVEAMAGLSHSSGRRDYGGPQRMAIPHAAMLLPPAVLPLLWAWHRRAERRRTSAGRCPSCGYDLRATPERCPECGAVPAVAR
jgi:hypothetical protein